MRRLRFDKKRILKSAKEYDRTFQVGKKVSAENILIFYIEADQCRVGFAVSKLIRGAVKRNRIKRRLREVVRLNQDALPEKKQLVLLARPGAEAVAFDRLQDELLVLLEKIKKQQKS